jgi:hypothetical protein
MSLRPLDPPFEFQGIRPFVQHSLIMVELHDQGMAPLKPVLDNGRAPPEIRYDPQPCALRMDHDPYRICCIMALGKGLNAETVNGDGLARVENDGS